MFHFPTRPSIFLSAPRQGIGLDVGRQHLRLAVVRRSRSRLRLRGLAEHRFTQVICRRGRITDLDLLCSAARALLAQCRVDHGVLDTALGAHATCAVRLTLPAAGNDLQRLAQVQADMALRHALSQEERVAHYCVLGRAPAGGDDVRVLALFPSLVDIEDRSALASSLRLRPGAIALRETRIAAFLRRAYQAPGAGVLHIDLDDTWLDVPGQWAHQLDWSAQGEPSVTLLHALAPLLQPAPQRLLLSGEAPMLASLAAVIGRYADLPTEVATLPQGFLDSADHDRPTPAFHAALALAAGAQA